MKDLTDSQQQKRFKILLIGDNGTDVYRFGTVDRISPEAPVPIFKFLKEEQRAGMSGNVEANLKNLGLDVYHLYGSKSIKTRLIDIKSKQHILRIDDDVSDQPLLFDQIDPELLNVDAIVISDYEKGFVQYTLVKDLLDYYEGPIFVDTKKTDLEYFEGCYVKVNAQERAAATSLCAGLITTLSAQGAEYLSVIYPAPATEVVDVCGAGDTFLSALTYQYLNTNDIIKAIEYANKAAAVTVRHLGAYAPTHEEIK